MRSPERPAVRPLWGPLGAGVFAAVGVGCLIFQLWLPSRLPGEADHQAAAAHLAAHARPGDALLLFPWWTGRARLHAPPEVEVVGHWGSDQASLRRHPRVWVLAQPTLPRADLAAFERAFSPGREALGPERRFGPLSLRAYRNHRYRELRFSAADALADARVYVEGPDGSRRPCRFDGEGHRCGEGARASVEWHEVAFEPLRCLFVQPPGGGARLVMELGPVPAAESLTLEAGYVWDRGFFREERLSEVSLRLEAPGLDSPVLELTLPPGTSGLRRATRPWPGAAPLRLSVFAQNPELREVCVRLQAEQPASAETAGGRR